MNNLNPNEIKTFQAICEAIQASTAGQFGHDDEIHEHVEGIDRKSLSGYCGSLAKKGLYWSDDEFGQIGLTEKGTELAKNLGDDRWYEWA